MTWQELEKYIRGQAADIGTATRERVSGVNFVTPDVVITRKVSGHLVEISYGRNFGGDGWLIGVTVCPSTSGESADPPALVWRSRCVTPDELPAVVADIVGTLTGAGVA